MPLPSPTRNIQDSLRRLKHDKWGWLIYRCTYGNDEAWSRFKQIIDQRSREIIADYDTPEAADSLEWTFVEDRGALDGASRDQLRARFKTWATEAVRTEQPRAEDHGTFGIPRYNFFIQVDESVLRSVVYEAPQSPEMDMHAEGYVNFVDANWKPLSERLPAEGGEGDESYEPIDGCREENVGWMKIASFMVGPDFYEVMSGFPDVWYSFYQRPPDTVIY
jgi:hypothetical protein